MTRRPGHRTTRGERLLADAIAAAGGPLDPNPSNAATVYAPAPFLRLRYEAAGTFAYQPLTDTLRRLDVFQTWLLQELDGVLSVADLTAKSRAAGFAGETEEIEVCLKYLCRMGFVHASHPRCSPSRTPVENPSISFASNVANAAPLFAFWEPTLRCNLYCKSCYNSSGPKAADGVDRAQVAAALVAAGVLRVTLLGGEPMMMPDFHPLITKLESAGICVEFVTNGWFLTERFLGPLLETRVAQFMVSVDGDVETNDRLRGRAGGFARALEGIRMYAAHGFAITGSLTLMSSNFHEMHRVVEKLVDAGVMRIKIRPLVPEGRGSDCFRSEGLDRDTYERCCEEIRALTNSLSGRVDLLLIVANNRVLREGEVYEHEVSAARTLSPSGLEQDTFYVRYDGKICRSSFERNVVLGDICTEPLPLVWQRNMAPAVKV